ncbi:MAG: metallopeptidase TldD-related protein [Candidatus Rifleibacteriota bacterium]
MIEQNIREIFCKVRDKAAARGICASFSLHREKSHLMRIGNNSVSLNTSENLCRLDIEVINGRQTGTHTQMGDISSVEYVEKALELAVEKARVASPKEYTPIPVIVEENIDESAQYDRALEGVEPSFKADGYQKIIQTTGEKYNFSGSWSSGSVELYLVSTENRNEAYHLGTDQDFNVVLKHPEKKWELINKQNGWRQSDFSADAAIKSFQELLPVYEKEQGFKPEPGEYTVAFGAKALAEIMMMAKWTGFYGRGWEEKQGWTSKNQPGDKILGENFSLVDDPACEGTYRFGFDMAGKKRVKFPVVEKGVLKALLYDNSTCAKYDKPQTGHSTGSVSLTMLPGQDPEDMLAAIKGKGRVLVIPALHYLNIPNSSKGIFTGSSRFNALLVENGKVVSPIFSSRVTDTFTSVFSNISLISSANRSINLSNTYGRRAPVAYSVPSYIVAEKVKITDSADSF